MSNRNLLYLGMNKKRSSSCSKPLPRDSIYQHYLLGKSCANNYNQSPYLVPKRSAKSFLGTPEYQASPTNRSTQISGISFSNDDSEEDFNLTEEAPKNFAIQDDEEIHPNNIDTLKPSDIDIAINMVSKEIFADSKAAVTYPFWISIKPKQEPMCGKLNTDIILVLDIMDNENLSSFANFMRNFLSYVDEKDRLVLLSTRGQSFGHSSRLSVMHENAKNDFMDELLANLHADQSHPLGLIQALKAAIISVKNRKYQNHIATIFIVTDRSEDIQSSPSISEDIKVDSNDVPLLYAFNVNQAHTLFGLQELCQNFEGKYYRFDSFNFIHEAMVACLSDLYYLQFRNIKLSIEIKTDEENDYILNISNAYESNHIIERAEENNLELHRNYFSIKNGIDVALEIQVAKCEEPIKSNKSLDILKVTLNGESVDHSLQFSLTEEKDIVINQTRPPLEMMLDLIDRKALEKFYQIKVGKKISCCDKLAHKGYIRKSLQSIIGLKKELYDFSMFRSEGMQELMDLVENKQHSLQSFLFKIKEKKYCINV